MYRNLIICTYSTCTVLTRHALHSWRIRHWVQGYQGRFSVNVWCGIVDNHVLGPHVLPVYRQFVEHELPGLLHEDVPLAARNSMWFMHDGATTHFSHEAWEYLDVAYPNRWMGRVGRVAWPPRSLDLNPLDSTFWDDSRRSFMTLRTCSGDQDDYV